jgi:hypothetical protein
VDVLDEWFNGWRKQKKRTTTRKKTTMPKIKQRMSVANLKVYSGLPDGKVGYQKYQFVSIFGRPWNENVGTVHIIIIYI